MRVVRRIFRQVADGQTLYSIKRSLEREGVPAPEGDRYWNMTFLRNVVLADVYRPHSYTEMEKLVAPEVAARLDKEKLYGIYWFNRTRATRKRVATLGPNGREYRWRTTRKKNPQDQWKRSRFQTPEYLMKCVRPLEKRSRITAGHQSRGY
jgi:hypothetical protein